MQFDCVKRFLQVMDYSHISTAIQIIFTIGHYFWAKALIVNTDLGVLGAALALNITYILNFLTQEIYM